MKKKLIAICLTAAMIFAGMSNVFAAEPEGDIAEDYEVVLEEQTPASKEAEVNDNDEERELLESSSTEYGWGNLSGEIIVDTDLEKVMPSEEQMSESSIVNEDIDLDGMKQELSDEIEIQQNGDIFDYSAEESADNQILNASAKIFDCIHSYIMKKGKTDEDGNKAITYNESNSTTTITAKDGELSFEILTIKSDYRALSMFTIYRSSLSTGYGGFIFVGDTSSYAGACAFNILNYTPGNTLSFTVVKYSGITESMAKTLLNNGNVSNILGSAYRIWDSYLVEETGFSIKDVARDGIDKVISFVERLYQVCLDRDPDKGGLSDWVSKLKKGSLTGVQAASGFIFSQEFKNKNYCNTCFVKQLYRAFMGREYDQGGLNNWVRQLESGKKREEVFNGFALSNEFNNLCRDYGITRGSGIGIPRYGTVPTGYCSSCGAEDGVTAFVRRLYQICLGREADAGGLNNWTRQLWNHTKSGKSVAQGFVFSAEFTNNHYNNTRFVELMYNAFFGRDADAAGKANWVKQLNAGKSRLDVFNGFADSAEFSNLCAKYGITAR